MNFIKLLLILIFITNCTLNKVVNHHGVHNLKKKNDKLLLLSTNTNNVISEIGIPSTKSTFDNDVWIYIERKTTSSDLRSLGKRKLLVNDILILEFDTRGLLVKKDFLSQDSLQKLVMTQRETQVLDKKSAFIDQFLSSLRQKINDPLGVKNTK
tara:strand:+ start:62 stop:523 length:462 start_codon:yes stop_codon:yes gene_type:complete